MNGNELQLWLTGVRARLVRDRVLVGKPPGPMHGLALKQALDDMSLMIAVIASYTELQNGQENTINSKSDSTMVCEGCQT